MHILWVPNLRSDRILLSRNAIWLRIAGNAASFPFAGNTDSIPSVTLHFGAWKKRFHFEVSELLPESAIGLPARVRDELPIPDVLPYEMYMDGTELHLGPVIAFLVSHGPLSPGTLDEYRGYFGRYEHVKGLIYVCSLAGIHPENKTIEGYGYHPQADGGQSPWIKGIFPYPDVVYRRIWIGQDKRFEDLLVQTEHKIFNPYFFNKQEMWESMRFHPQLRHHLPHTLPLDNRQTVEKMLKLHGSVYLKPVSGSMGSGVMKLQRAGNGYQLASRQKPEAARFKNESQAWSAVRRLCKGKKYLIQQSVSYTTQNKNVDFRVIMQKDGSQQWTCTGIVARFGEEGRFYTNDVSSVCIGNEALRTVFQLNDAEAARMEEEIIFICTTACEWLDHHYGTFGDVGIDVIVDADLKVWLIEINSNHQHVVPAYLKGDLQMYKNVLTKPFEFAKAWAGFRS